MRQGGRLWCRILFRIRGWTSNTGCCSGIDWRSSRKASSSQVILLFDLIYVLKVRGPATPFPHPLPYSPRRWRKAYFWISGFKSKVLDKIAFFEQINQHIFGETQNCFFWVFGGRLRVVLRGGCRARVENGSGQQAVRKCSLPRWRFQ